MNQIKSICAFLLGNDLAGGVVVEIPWIGRVVARTVGIGKVVEHCVQAEVVPPGGTREYVAVALCPLAYTLTNAVAELKPPGPLMRTLSLSMVPVPINPSSV
jgi:hypothetical protein